MKKHLSPQLPAHIGGSSFLATIKACLTLICVTFSTAAAQTLIHYRVNSTDDPADGVPNLGFLNNGTMVGSGAGFAGDRPTVGVPPDAGDRSLYFDGSGGITAPGTKQLLNAEIFAVGGFTYEAWFRYLGGGNVNSIIDYAGTEKLDRPADGDGPRMQTNNGIFDPIADAAEDEWHYVAVVFSNVSSSDGGVTVTGDYTYYFDSNVAQETVSGITISTFGDSLDRTIGVGMHPEGFAGDFFNGLIFEPRVTYGALTPAQLLFQPEPPFLTTEADGKLTITGYDSDGDGTKDCPVGELVIPASIGGLPVTAIGSFAFIRCSDLTALTLPDGLESIGANVFFGCSSLTAVTVPAGVTSIGINAFAACERLTAITVAESNQNFSSSDGVLYDKTGNTLLQFPCGKTGTFSVPPGVTSIGFSAFFDCSGLTSLDLPVGLASIEGQAFRGCTGLTSLLLPGGLTTIEGGAFAGCSGLTAVYFLGDAPSLDPFSVNGVFPNVGPAAKVYYVPGTSGWGATYGAGEDGGGDFVDFDASPVDAWGTYSSPYRTVEGIFLATATTAPLVIRNHTDADSTLLIDDFRIGRNSTRNTVALSIHVTGPDTAQLEWDSTAGERFEVFQSSDLKTWNSIATVNADDVHTVTVFEGVDTSGGRAFYRVEQVR